MSLRGQQCLAELGLGSGRSSGEVRGPVGGLQHAGSRRFHRAALVLHPKETS